MGYGAQNISEGAGDIGMTVKLRKEENGFMHIRIARTNSTMPMMTYELERIAHSLRSSKYNTTQKGFPYNLPAELGE